MSAIWGTWSRVEAEEADAVEVLGRHAAGEEGHLAVEELAPDGVLLGCVGVAAVGAGVLFGIGLFRHGAILLSQKDTARRGGRSFHSRGAGMEVEGFSVSRQA
jgi:hypothetical protein